MFGRKKRTVPGLGETRAEPLTHHRKPTLGEKMDGFGKKIRGSFSGRPGEKSAGTRMMKGEGPRSRRRRFF